ncbi:hypothetical protein R1sor_014091 [Riccia sorocarpa]|uniref:Uncharacterized protein n=1 Tax=Riccia sorocarpa TaxID=122646 RepID=A0ABD3H8E4_9MARC
MNREQNDILREAPDAELIERIVRSLPKEKSPGINEVIVEVLTLVWQFMQHNCVVMVQNVWSKQMSRERQSNVMSRTRKLSRIRSLVTEMMRDLTVTECAYFVSYMALHFLRRLVEKAIESARRSFESKEEEYASCTEDVTDDEPISRRRLQTAAMWRAR